MAGALLESELENGIWPIFLPRRLHYVIANAGDVGHEGKFIGRVGLDRVGANGRFQPLDGRASYRSVITEGMYRGMGTLLIGGQQKPAVAVSGQKGGTGLY